VGNGPEYNDINNLIANHHLEEKILLHSAIASEDVPFIYHLIDVLLIPRPSTLSTETAIPLKPIEALACKKNVVGTKVKGLIEFKEMVKDGVYLFDSVDEIVSFLRNFNIEEYKLNVIPEKVSFFSYIRQSDKLLNIYKNLIISN
jgi:glycosyltransferase involved in cell wall biosynthesis